MDATADSAAPDRPSAIDGRLDSEAGPAWPSEPVPAPWRVDWIGEPPPAAPPVDAGPAPDSAPADVASPDGPTDVTIPADAGHPDGRSDGESSVDGPAADAARREASPGGGEPDAGPDGGAASLDADDRWDDQPPWAQAYAMGSRLALTAGGRGVELTATADQFLFVHQSVAGDFRLDAVVREMAGCPPGRVTFGVMVRASLAPGSPYAMAAVSGTPGAVLQGRPSTSALANVPRIDNGVGLPLFLRVSRRGAQVTAAYSRDGTAWHESQLTLTGLGDRALVGLAASSHRGALACGGLFAEVAIGN